MFKTITSFILIFFIFVIFMIGNIWYLIIQKQKYNSEIRIKEIELKIGEKEVEILKTKIENESRK